LARGVLGLLGALVLTLTVLPSSVGAATGPVPMRTAALLPHRSCAGLLSAADFPGLAYTGQLHLHGQDICSFAGGDAAAPTGASLNFEVFASTAAAHAFFIMSTTAPLPADLGSREYTKLRAYGNEAAYGTVCSPDEDGTRVCGLSIEVRVVNDFFSINEFGISVSLTRLAGMVVTKLKTT
jgi:hypothetical protein